MGSKGGSQRLTIASSIAQGADQSCKKVYIMPASTNTGVIRVNIDSACTAITGVPVGKFEDDIRTGLWVHVENVAQLNFYGEDDDIVDILWVY